MLADLWNRLRGVPTAAERESVEAALARLVAGYPANPPPFPGAPRSVTRAENEANLAHFLATREERLAVVCAFLAERGVDARPLLDPAADGGPAARAVDGWLTAALPRRPFSVICGDETPNADYRRLEASDRSGPDLYHSLVADLGLLEGEAIRRRDGRFGWAINRLPDFHDMASFHRICLILPGQPGWAATVLDMEALMLSICHSRMAPSGDFSGQAFGLHLDHAVHRRFDPLAG